MLILASALLASSVALVPPAMPACTRHTRATAPRLAVPPDTTLLLAAAASRPARRLGLAGITPSFRPIIGGDIVLSRVELSFYLAAAAACGSAITAVVFTLREQRRQRQAAANASNRGTLSQVVTDVGKRAITDAQVTAAWLGPKV